MEHTEHTTFATTISRPPTFLSMPATGIDITDRAVRYVRLERRGALHRVAASGTRSLPEGAVVGGEIVDMRALVEVLSKLRRDLRSPLVRLALPEERAYIFQTSVPSGAQRSEARAAIEFKLEEHVPVSAAEAVFGFESVVHRRADKEEGGDAPGTETPASVTVYQRQLVDAYLEVCTAAGFTPLSFEAKMHAAARAVLTDDDAPSSMLLVDLGAHSTTLAVASHNVVQFSATIEVGEDAIAAVLEKEEKRTGERAADEQAAAVGTLSALRDEINRHITYWETHTSTSGHEAEPVSEIILCGGRSTLLAHYLRESTELPVRVPNVWQHAFTFDKVIPEIPAEASLRFAAAVGLALREGL